jgi:hypothetical protein
LEVDLRGALRRSPRAGNDVVDGFGAMSFMKASRRIVIPVTISLLDIFSFAALLNCRWHIRGDQGRDRRNSVLKRYFTARWAGLGVFRPFSSLCAAGRIGFYPLI